MPHPSSCGARLAALLLLPALVWAAAPRDAASLTKEYCVTCHNQNLVGSPAPNLVDALWTYGGSDEAILRNLRQGFPASGMQAFEGVLTETEMRSIIRYLRGLAVEYAAGRITHPTQPASLPLQTELTGLRIETYVADLETPWGIAFLPDGGMLVSEREGRLRVVRDGKLQPEPVRDTPRAFVRQDGGLLDVALHPDFARNGWVYLAYVDSGRQADTSMTVVVRGKIRDNRWIDQQEIFRAPPERYYSGHIHYGCRFLFDRAGHLFFTIGDRGRSEDAQDLASPCGKIHRVMDDGRIPPDNPFVHQAGAWPSIWTLGNRHPQGLVFHPVTGKLWESEHGPSGGDEVNRIESGHNYGWPVVSSGTDRRMQFLAEKPGMDSPRAAWTPSVAPAGIEFYTGDRVAAWKHHLFVACLGGEQLKRLETDGDRVTHQEIVFKGLGRVRDVVTGPDGLIYLAMNTPGRIARLVPDASVGTANASAAKQAPSGSKR
jgi:glucose/arabinose dehydrogenase